MKEPLQQPALSQIKEVAKQLCEWTDMAAHAYGHYVGANQAIKAVKGKSSVSANMAHEMRQQLALMAVVRCFAVLDRDSQYSFQGVYRLLGSLSGPEKAAMDPNEIERFLERYREIDFGKLGNMQSFRNHAIAHLSWKQASRFITYGDLEKLILICCDLSHSLNLIADGMNNAPVEHFEDARDSSIHFWSAAIRTEEQEKMEW